MGEAANEEMGNGRTARIGDVMNKSIIRQLCLTEELETARKLIVSGFGELQEIRMDNDFYHLPHQLLASGFERLMKCYFCLVYEARNGRWPNTDFLKKPGHDLQKLKQALIEDYYSTNDIPILCGDLEYLKNDSLLEKIIHVLSEFGQKARYYNLDIITGNQKPPIDPKAEWETLEKDIEDPILYLSEESMETLEQNYYPRVNAKIIAKLERLCRAIALQFTLGNHGGHLQHMSTNIIRFIHLQDDNFGRNDYRRSVKILQNEKELWSKRSEIEITNGPWLSRIIPREDFTGDWPFRFDEVIIELRESMFCIINIEGYDFALNGAAKSRFGFPFPHDAGIAFLGNSIGPFIDMALNLSATKTTGNKP